MEIAEKQTRKPAKQFNSLSPWHMLIICFLLSACLLTNSSEQVARNDRKLVSQLSLKQMKAKI